MHTRSLNLGILAHVDAGTTQTDSLALERRRGITIKAAVVAFPLDDATVNVVDTPGQFDHAQTTMSLLLN